MTRYAGLDLPEISGMSVLAPSDWDKMIIPQDAGFIGFFPNQVESLDGYELHYMGEFAHNAVFGQKVRFVWFSNIWDKTSQTYLLGVYAAEAREFTTFHESTSIVRFRANGVQYTVKSNHWAFVPKSENSFLGS